ncbi:hypothetical protein C8E87_1995 [Paractinoplanes brasiliensis]|uniref:Uncharacterized protein n=1 Tax=Paractinoplanes brasiliensis TaxID=52695 RepID=A0A4R6JRJ2_9ACTN|nr:hypothetical protein C8E87_1995 [Actinoplanes brasiliensis]
MGAVAALCLIQFVVVTTLPAVAAAAVLGRVRPVMT